MVSDTRDTMTSTDSTNGVIPGVSDLAGLSRLERVRLVAFGLVVLATIGLAVMVLGPLFSLLILGWTADGGAQLGVHRLHVMALAMVVLTTLFGAFVQVYRPTKQVAAMLGALISIVLVVVVGLVAEGSPGSAVPFLVLIGLATLLHPAGRTLLRRGQSYSPVMLAFVVIAAIPMLAFTVAQVGLQVNAADAHAAAGHYTGMARFGLVPLVYGVLAAIGMRGWRVAAWIAALPVAYYGLLSISFPAQTGSTGVMWGAAAILWAVGFVGVAEYSRVGASPTLRRSAARQG